MRLKMTREQKIADRFLRSFDMIDDRLASSLRCLENAESARSSITGSIEAMGLSGSQNDKMCTSLVRMDSAIEDIAEMAAQYSAQFLEIEEFITHVQRLDTQAGKVLRLIYINRATVKEVAENEEIACSKKTVYEHLKRGLDIAFWMLSKEGE